jgi:hypothetical protein
MPSAIRREARFAAGMYVGVGGYRRDHRPWYAVERVDARC